MMHPTSYAAALAHQTYRDPTPENWFAAAEARDVEADVWEEEGLEHHATCARNQAKAYRGYAQTPPDMHGDPGSFNPRGLMNMRTIAQSLIQVELMSPGAKLIYDRDFDVASIIDPDNHP